MKTAPILGAALAFVATAAVSQPPGGLMAPSRPSAGTTTPSSNTAPSTASPAAQGSSVPPPPTTPPPPSLPPLPTLPSASAPTPAAPAIGGGGPGVSFRNLDANGDGRLSPGELQDPALISSFRQLDANNDGVLSELEFGSISNPVLRR